MKNSDSKRPLDSDIKNHSEILQIIDEIIAYEQNITDIKSEVVEEVEDIKQDLIEVAHEEIVIEENVSEEVVEAPEKKFFKFLKRKEEKEPKPKVHNIFKMGFNEEGNFVNLDLRQPKPKKEPSKLRGKVSNLKKIIPFKRKGGEEKSSDSESTSKLSKLKGLKGGLGKVGKLKKVIPNKKSSGGESKEE